MPKKKDATLNEADAMGATEASDTAIIHGMLSLRGPLPEDHRLYAVIGRVASAMAHLEHILDLIIWDLASIRPEKGACITGQFIGPGPRYYAILALGMTHGLKEKTLDIIRELMRKNIDVYEERNRIVHDAWYLETPSGNTFQFRSMPRKDPAYGFKEIDYDNVTETLEKLKRRIDRVSNLRSRILDELQP